MYKILALDLDGTLLDPNHEVSKTNIENINKLIDKGVKIILVSGREPSSIAPIGRKLGLKDCLVGFNGAIITDYTGEKVIYEQNIDSEVTKEILEICMEKDIYNVVFIRNKLYVSNKDDDRFKLFEKYTTTEIEEVGNLYEFLDKNNLWESVGKTLQSGDNEILTMFKEKNLSIYRDDITAEFSLPFFLEVYNSGASKGHAMAKIGETYGIDRDKIIAIGDGENDISMIEYAGVGIAMENGLDIVKKNADFITLSNSEDGVSYAIKKYWGE